MDQILLGEIDEMVQYQKYNLKVADVNELNINDSNELEDVSSESEDEAPDKDDGNNQN